MAATDSEPPPLTPAPPRPVSNVISDAVQGIPSSSPAFATPAPNPRRQPVAAQTAVPLFQRPHTPSVLPVQIPPATLRPIAFRTFTKKHNLTLNSSALQSLAGFVGKNCGSKWREEGLGELVCEEIARVWKRCSNEVIVDDAADISGKKLLQEVLKGVEERMAGGKIVGSIPLSRQNSLLRQDSAVSIGEMGRQDSFGMSGLMVTNRDEDLEEHETHDKDPRRWLKVVSAFDQPSLLYNPSKNHFEPSKTKPSLLPSAGVKTELFRQRYHLLHQRILRNESFQPKALNGTGSADWRITPVSNLLGRSGTPHLLLGLLTVSPTGHLTLADPTGSIHLDLSSATPIDTEVETWLCPGFIVLVDGVYEESYNPAGGALGNGGGIGGMIGGRFIAFQVGAPRCEPRAVTLGVQDMGSLNVGGGFGWVDFLATGSERAVGSRMRKIEQSVLRSGTDERHNSNKMVIMGECNLDKPATLAGIRKILALYSTMEPISAADAEAYRHHDLPPMTFVLHGSFTTHAAMASTPIASGTNNNNSISYKESWDALASLLSEFPQLLRSSTWVFVPGDNDPWPSAFSAGASVALPRDKVPEIFTSRIKRAFANATSTGIGKSNEDKLKGEPIFTSNPSRLSLFGPCYEILLFRDDISGRLRRNAIPLKTPNEPKESVEATVQQAPSIPPATTAQDATTAMDVDDSIIASEAFAPNTQRSTPSNEHKTQEASTTAPQRLVKSLLDQSNLSPFPLNVRPVHWSYAHTLSLYPLPSTLILCDSDIQSELSHQAPGQKREENAFILGYQGCTVIGVGKLVSNDSGVDAAVENVTDVTVATSRQGAKEGGAVETKKRGAKAVGRPDKPSSLEGRRARLRVRWVEYDILAKKGRVRSIPI